MLVLRLLFFVFADVFFDGLVAVLTYFKSLHNTVIVCLRSPLFPSNLPPAPCQQSKKIQQALIMCCLLIVHSPTDVPVGIQPTAYVTGSSMLSVALSLNTLHTSHKIKTWEPDIRNCYYQHERNLKFFKIYTLHNCEVECRANNTLKICGCNAYFQPRDPGVPVCGTDNLECIRESSTIGYSIFKTRLNMSINIKSCNCLPSCTNVLYEYETVEFFRNWTTNSTKPKLVLTEESALVMIYFKRKYVIDIQKTPLMPFNELLGNIGGLFGLFLGCSIISFFEILYFFVIRLYFDRRNSRKAKSKIMPSFILE